MQNKRSGPGKPGETKGRGPAKPGGKGGYGAKGGAEQKAYGGKPGYKKSFGGAADKPGYKKDFGGAGDKPGYRQNADNAEQRTYGDKPGYKKNFNGPRGGSGGPDGYRAQGSADGRPSGDKPGYRKSFDNGEQKPYGDKPGYRRSFDNGGQKPYGDKPAYQRAPREGGGSYYGRRIAQEGEENLPGGQDETDELPYLIIGRNAVREAVKSGRSIDRILVMEGPDGSLRETVDLARDRKLLIREVDKKKLDELCMPFGHGGKTANHQGIVAYAAGVSYCTVSDILAAAKDKGEEPFVIVLDEIQDPHNLGSIIRSADCAGAHGVVIGKRRSASVTSAAVKASAGAVEHMPVARVTNVTETLKELKQAGLWIAGGDMDGTPMSMQSLTGPLALVVGGEGEGLSRLVRESCDFLVSIPMSGHIGSLNASVAAAILMFEKRRQDNART